MNVEVRQHFAALAVAVARNRDQIAFCELFDFFAPRLKSFLMRQNAGVAEAEEVVQEVMVILWQKAYLYDPEKSSLSTWLFRIARNRRIDVARRQRKGALDAYEPLLLPAAPPTPDDLIESEDREQIVRIALAKLPPEQVTLIQMAFFFGQSHSEISAATGLPLGTVKSRIRLAFGKLRALLEEDGVDSAH
ncbi:sigma-70 family RNA polymerase sigma factor [Pararhizobium sp. YC-54]|uniref:sigma-70 family RNA polymerase sigma factor n=1 Tax=Pararhizobium sp. YC-54 TaxID=2986920 RepID=UPI0021F76C81|nr:sigma-70 family RNA polymerase sigma factor [Pararhizobium sp. YC-54]MCV9998032.1 sigma-70 family RNA polymerase sigma factor [Pararhizobium sp. YC-54]